MAELTVSNIDEILRALRSERGDIEKREKVRDEEYKRATKLYIKALQKETEAFERNRPNYDKRNESFKEEMKDIKDRFKVGAFGLIKSNDRLHKEVDRLNNHLLEHYPKLASDVKNNLQREKEELEIRLQRAKEANQKNQIPYSQLSGMPSVGVMEIREKRHQLERDLRPSGTPAFTNFPRSSLNYPGYSESHLAGHSNRHSPYRGQSYLDEFVARPNAAEIQNEISRRSPQGSLRPAPVDVYSQSYPQGEVRSRTPPPYDRERDIRVKSKSPPRTDMLSDFMFQIPKAVFSPPQDELRRKQSPAKSESLLYSPFTGGDNDSRFSRLSSVKKSQNF